MLFSDFFGDLTGRSFPTPQRLYGQSLRFATQSTSLCTREAPLSVTFGATSPTGRGTHGRRGACSSRPPFHTSQRHCGQSLRLAPQSTSLYTREVPSPSAALPPLPRGEAHTYPVGANCVRPPHNVRHPSQITTSNAVDEASLILAITSLMTGE